MNGSELATLSTIGWVILTLAFLIVFGTWSAGESWTILPGLVRGVHDWATEHVVARPLVSPSPWSVTPPAPPGAPAALEPAAPDELAEMEELWERPT